MADNSPTDQQFERIIELLSKIADEDPKEAQAKSDEKRRSKKNLKALTDNALALVGLSRGMWSLTKVVGDQLAMNSKLAEGLGQTANVSKGVNSVMKRFITGQQSFAQKVKVWGDQVALGMTTFSNKTSQFGSQLKVLGLQNKSVFQLMRANTQGLGLSEEASLRLANELVTTAAENKDSISGLIDAINGMKDAMVSTTVELGPKTAMNAKKVAAMMTQNNSELQEASAKFVKSFLAGSDGYMKAAKLGVVFQKDETSSSMARKFETILSEIESRQAGKAGAGSQFFFDSQERMFGLTRDDFNLQRQIGTSINALVEGNVHGLSRASARINLQQSMNESLDGIQSLLSKLVEEVTQGFNKIRVWVETSAQPMWDAATTFYDTYFGKDGKGAGALVTDVAKDAWDNSSDTTKVIGGTAAILGINGLTKAIVGGGGSAGGSVGLLGGVKLLAKKIPLVLGLYAAWTAKDDLMAGKFGRANMQIGKTIADAVSFGMLDTSKLGDLIEWDKNQEKSLMDPTRTDIDEKTRASLEDINPSHSRGLPPEVNAYLRESAANSHKLLDLAERRTEVAENNNGASDLGPITAGRNLK